MCACDIFSHINITIFCFSKVNVVKIKTKMSV